MKKPELIDAIASKTGESKKVVENIVNETFQTIVNTLKSNEAIDIYGFGKFESVFKEERMGKNPRTGEEKLIPSKYTPKLRFKPAVKKLLNE